MGSSVLIDGSFTTSVQPAFLMQAPRKREIEHLVQDGSLITDLLATKDVFLLKYNHLTQTELNSLMLLYSQTGVNSYHTLRYFTDQILRIWDGVTVPAAAQTGSIETPYQTNLDVPGTSIFSANREVGWRFSVTANGTIDALYLRIPHTLPDIPSFFTVSLWNATTPGLLASVVITPPVSFIGLWTIGLITPVSVVSGNDYIVSVGVPGTHPLRDSMTAVWPATYMHVSTVAAVYGPTLGVMPVTVQAPVGYYEGLVDFRYNFAAVPAINPDVNRIRKKIKFDVFDPPHKENVPNEYTVTLACKET